MVIRKLEPRYPEVEGALDMIFGPIGGGKTTYATKLLLSYLRQGVPVFASWPINFEGTDDTKNPFFILLGLFGLKRRYRRISSANFHYIPLSDFMSDAFLEKLAHMTDCVVAVDEAYAARLFDSYRKTNMSVEARMSIYATRHFNRRFIIVAQRPNSVHVSARAMINRFYRCDRPLPWLQKFLHLRLFIVQEFQDMVDETVDVSKPYSTRIYWPRNWLFKAFDSKYMRGTTGRLYTPLIEDFRVGYGSVWGLMFRLFRRTARPLRGASSMSVPIKPKNISP